MPTFRRLRASSPKRYATETMPPPRRNASASQTQHLLRHLEFQGPLQDPRSVINRPVAIDRGRRDQSTITCTIRIDDLSNQSDRSVNRCNDTANPTRILARPRIIRSISRKRKRKRSVLPGSWEPVRGGKNASLFTVHAQIAGISIGWLERGS